MSSFKYNECREFYNNASQMYSKLARTVGVDVISGMILINTDKKKEDIHILDAGCGTGLPAKNFIKLGFRHLTLLDQSPGMVEHAKTELATEIQDGYVHGVHEASLPVLPFPDNSFDVVNLSMILYHVEGRSDGIIYPDTKKTLIEATRVLRPDGLITILTLTPFTMSEAAWFTQLIPHIKAQFPNHMPSVKQMNDIFAECNLQCLSQLRLLGPEQTGSWYTNVRDALNPEWRDAFPYFVFATESEIKDMEYRLKEMDINGTLDKWWADNDKTHELGLFTFFICRRK